MPNVEYENQSALSLSDYLGVQPFVGMTGAVPDCRQCSDAAITAGGTTLTSATAAWSSEEWGRGLAGKFIAVAGAGPGGEDLITTIRSFTDTGTLELSDAASTSVSGAACIWGTDNTQTLQEAFDTFAPLGVVLRLHFGSYLTGRLSIPSGLHLAGSGPSSSKLLFMPGASSNNYAMLEAAGIESATVTRSITLRDFGIDGLGGYSGDTYSWHGTQHMSLAFLFYVEDVLISNVRFENSNICCLAYGSCTRFTVKDCWFGDSLPGNVFSSIGYGTSFIDQNSRAYVYASGAMMQHENYGVTNASPSSDIKIFNNTFRGDISNGSCCKNGAASGREIQNVKVANNTIYVGGQRWNTAPTVLDAPSQLAGDTLGVEFWQGGDQNCFRKLNITGNTIECLVESETEAFAISVVGNCSKVAITGNTIVNCRAYGVEYISSDGVIAGNYLEKSVIAVTAFDGYTIQNIAITGNTLIDPTPSSYGTDNNYPSSAISLGISGAATGSAALKNVVVSGNTIRIDGGSATGISNVEGIRAECGSATADEMSNVKISSNVISGTGNSRERGIIVACSSSNNITKQITVEFNTISVVPEGIYIGAYVKNGRFWMNDIDTDTVTYPYNAASIDPTCTIGQHATDTLDRRNFNVPSIRMSDEDTQTVDGYGNIMLANVGSTPRFISSAPSDGSINLPNIIVLNSMQHGTQQGGYISVNSRYNGFPAWEQTSKKFTFTADSGTDVLTFTGDTTYEDYFANGSVVYVNTSGTLPNPLAENTAYYVIDKAPGSLRLSLTSGGSAVDITTAGSGTHYLMWSPYTVIEVLSPTLWGLRYGNSDNPTGGAEPGSPGISVIFPQHLEQLPVLGVAGPGLYCWLGPIYPDFDYGPGLRSCSGDPNGVLDGGHGMLAMDARSGGPHLWVKATGWGVLTGWVDLGPASGFWTASGADAIKTPYRVLLDDPSNSRGIGVTVTPTTNLNQIGTPAFSSTGFSVDYLGKTRVETLGVGTAAPSTSGNATINGTTILSALTASLPLKLNASKEVLSAKIDLGAAADITGTGLGDTQFLYWDATSGTVKSKTLTQADISDFDHTHSYGTLATDEEVDHTHTNPEGGNVGDGGQHTHGITSGSTGGVE